jgi:hypothetical protein
MNAIERTKYYANILDIDLEYFFLAVGIANFNNITKEELKEREELFKMFDDNEFLIDYRDSHNKDLKAIALIKAMIEYIETNLTESIKQIKYNDKMVETLNLYKELQKALIDLKSEVDNLETYIINLDIENADTFGDATPYTISLFNKDNNDEYIPSFVKKTDSKGGKKKIRTKCNRVRYINKRKSKKTKKQKSKNPKK